MKFTGMNFSALLATAFVAGVPDAEFRTTPAVVGGLVFVGCSDDSLYAIQA